VSGQPQRIVVVGCSGSGKSTLARALGARTGLPVVHLDTLYWHPGWSPPPDQAAFRAEVQAVIAGDRWIIDGGFTAAGGAERMARADLIVLFDLPRVTCLWRAIRRYIAYRGTSRPDLAPGCPERVDFAFYRYIWTYRRKVLPKLEALIAAHGRGRRVCLRHDRDTAALLAEF
jgi:adenylate kinase family enzyme